jgi:hypothetical protein
MPALAMASRFSFRGKLAWNFPSLSVNSLTFASMMIRSFLIFVRAAASALTTGMWWNS